MRRSRMVAAGGMGINPTKTRRIPAVAQVDDDAATDRLENAHMRVEQREETSRTPAVRVLVLGAAITAMYETGK